MAVAFAMKLRMAAAALGCDSRKELCARFREVNPATQCDLDRLNKWIQGRSLPRAGSVYADFASVIGTGHSGHWVAACSLEEFAAELAGRTGVDPAALVLSDSLTRRGRAQGGGMVGGLGVLAGAFAGYSRAWSPRAAGRLLRGSLRLGLGKGGALTAAYTEALVGREVRLVGEASIAGRAMHFVVREPAGDVPLFFSLHSPGPPAAVLCGIMSGLAFVADETLPSACRVVFVRVPDTAGLDRSNRYLDPAPGAIAADLRALGVEGPGPRLLDAFARDFLAAPPDQVTARDQAALAGLLDGGGPEADGGASRRAGRRTRDGSGPRDQAAALAGR